VRELENQLELSNEEKQRMEQEMQGEIRFLLQQIMQLKKKDDTS